MWKGFQKMRFWDHSGSDSDSKPCQGNILSISFFSLLIVEFLWVDFSK